MAWEPDYLTTAELKAYLKITGNADDTEIATAITAASRAIDNHCNRQFGQVSSAELRKYTAYPDYDRGVWCVDIDDLDDITGLTVLVDGVTTTAYTLEPVNAVVRKRVFERLVIESDASVTPTGDSNELSITAKWGWTSVPVVVKQAAKLQASRLFKRRDSAFGIAGSADIGSELRLLSRVDVDVAVHLSAFRRLRQVG